MGRPGEDASRMRKRRLLETENDRWKRLKKIKFSSNSQIALCCFLATLCFITADAYKILVVFPIPGKSHTILGDGVVKHLAEAGHDITYITPILKKNVPKNVRQIDVSDNFKIMSGDIINIKEVMNKEVKLDMDHIFNMMLKFHNVTYHNPNVQKLLSDTSETFDLVIAEWMFSQLYSALAGIYNVPYIWVSTVEPHWMVLRLIDEATNPTYTADAMSSCLPPFTFAERVTQLMNQLFATSYMKIVGDSFEHKVYSSLTPYFKMRGREPPSLKELSYNASLMLGNSHVSMGQPMALPSNYKNIGGYHIETKVPPLPKDLKKLMDNSKHGVIYFSMGSNIQSKHLPVELKQGLLKMFESLNQTIIWKFEEELPGLPSNVHILKWAPQPSILAHPNCVLFITHGGLLSTTETIHFAKPIIGIPVFGDQFSNVDRAVAKGFAKRADLTYNMADELRAAIKDILRDPTYSNKVKELSFIYHHRPTPPSNELVHWVEHVIRTGGAPHLRSPALGVPLYQKLYLDLLALIVLGLWLIKTAIAEIFKKSFTKKEKIQ